MGDYEGSVVRLWVNGHAAGSQEVSGGVTQNNVDVLLGADPQGASGTRFFFRGKVQSALVQRWTSH